MVDEVEPINTKTDVKPVVLLKANILVQSYNSEIMCMICYGLSYQKNQAHLAMETESHLYDK